MKVKLLILSFLAPIALLSFQAVSAATYNPLSSACQGKAASSPACQQNAAQQASGNNPVVDRIHTAADLLAIVSGIAAVVVIIYSGFVFATAGGSIGGQRSGDSNRAKQARAMLTGGIVGLIIVALAWSIVTFLTDKVIQ
jgi:hypothetical protein